ncbi:MAG: zinc dependent phospholipase C family protein [Oscillospiraceae bacterium]|jgi:hypothetical protein|nr:zinc dependent phospholipase C family protein [Oscillospiraceae bacterium]
MPAAYLHEQLALGARTAAATAYPAVASLPTAPLLTGAQGPDPFFFYKMLSLFRANRAAVESVGTLLHERRTNAFLLALLRHGMRSGPDSLAYALGFVTHYAADSTAHPFVYAHSFDAAGAYQSNLHCGLEAALDTWLYREQGHPQGVPLQMAGMAALTEPQRGAVTTALRVALGQVFPEHPVDEPAIRHCLADSVRTCRLLYSPRGIKYRLLCALGALLGQRGLVEAHALPLRLPQNDFLNLAHAAWCSPFEPGWARDESFSDIFAQAQARAANLLTAAWLFTQGEMEEEALAALLGNLHYDSGTALRDC